jgi:DNA repair exonuclease SbcCD ATPase subunit
MKITRFAFKNICSYGNKLQTFTFSEDPQLILVQGKNGGGKSSISDALTVSLYGKSAIRKTKEIPNRINKNAYTQIEFMTGSGDLVEIERGIEPNFSKLLINGVEHNLPDKRRVDDFIEDELTKIPFNVFSNTISLSVNDFKSFVKLSPHDKRQIIDKIFGLDIVNDMSRVIKDEVRELRASLQTIESNIQNNESLLSGSRSQLLNLEQDLTTAKESRIQELQTEINSLTNSKNEYKSVYTGMTSELQSLERDLTEAREAKSRTRLNISEIQKKLDLYSKNKCPHCLSDLTDALHLGIKEKLVQRKSDQETNLPTLDESIQAAQLVLTAKQTEQNNARDKYYQIDGILAPIKRELSELRRESGSDSQKGTEYLNGVISSIEEKISNLNSERSTLSAKLNVSQEMEVILSDNGMKRLLMSQIIPMLNKKILKTSKLLEFKFAFEFDLEFNPIITHLGMQISPDSLSAGEQKKMNLIVLLCILELLKLKHHRVNLLFLDEVFSSLDVDSIYRVVDLLKTFAKKYNMTVFVISHDPLPEEFFDIKLTVENNDHFSDIKMG